jgi:hypothetical protein
MHTVPKLTRNELGLALSELYWQAIEFPNAPEALEAFHWRQIPYSPESENGVEIPCRPEWTAFVAADDLPLHEWNRSVRITPSIRGTLARDTPTGRVDLPFWIGWDPDEQEVVIVCGSDRAPDGWVPPSTSDPGRWRSEL